MESACYSVCDTLAEPNFWKSNFESFKSNQASRKRCRHVFNISCSLFIYKFTDWKSLITAIYKFTYRIKNGCTIWYLYC